MWQVLSCFPAPTPRPEVCGPPSEPRGELRGPQQPVGNGDTLPWVHLPLPSVQIWYPRCRKLGAAWSQASSGIPGGVWCAAPGESSPGSLGASWDSFPGPSRSFWSGSVLGIWSLGPVPASLHARVHRALSCRPLNVAKSLTAPGIVTQPAGTQVRSQWGPQGQAGTVTPPWVALNAMRLRDIGSLGLGGAGLWGSGRPCPALRPAWACGGETEGAFG